LPGCHIVSLVRASLALYLTITGTQPFDALFCLWGGGPANQPLQQTGPAPRYSEV
jgi:hypothetical protein